MGLDEGHEFSAASGAPDGQPKYCTDDEENVEMNLASATFIMDVEKRADSDDGGAEDYFENAHGKVSEKYEIDDILRLLRGLNLSLFAVKSEVNDSSPKWKHRKGWEEFFKAKDALCKEHRCREAANLRMLTHRL